MAHERVRAASDAILKLGKYWPVVGVVGARQVGKTTLIRDLLKLGNPASLDELEIRDEARSSPKSFLAKRPYPVMIDEIQKAPELFDAIKAIVDKKRIPGSFYISGSAGFSTKIGIRESLTGRMGLLELLPMTLAELQRIPFQALSHLSAPRAKPRFSVTDVSQGLAAGGMPVPAFTRSLEQRALYWGSWFQTALYRDLSLFFRRGYDADLSVRILEKMGTLLREGELPTLKHFPWPAQRMRAYLSALEEIFVLRRIQCHEEGIGKDVWLFSDAGMATHFMKTQDGEAATLSLARHFVWNEWAAQAAYQTRRFQRIYYKTAQGAPVDAFLDGALFKIVPSVTAVTRRLRWEERALVGAMKKLGVKRAFLVAPVDEVEIPKKGGIGILPWASWS